ncbi:HAMP domain-containing sensor histidine kinase [Demequina sp. NBRC 110056]|uniref:sensor histidine kinase n=1 Tax=Demequina sp. NBRC 110056 TaxID=1570345 RepID=UPI0013564050|nr:HAMP domain-containing sensor histidine kinase [Demequina sp. NBRC 110056]
MSEADVKQGRRPRLMRRPTVRTAILAAVIALTGLALIVSGWVAAQLQSLRVDARIDDDLAASAEEFRVLATVGIDPETGEPFTSPEDLVRTAMERIIPSRNEGVLGVVGGEIRYTSRGAPLPLEDDPDLIAQLEPYVTAEEAQFVTITTDVTTYRVAIVPVRTAPDGSLAEGPDDAAPAFDSVASLVMAYDVDAERAEFNEVFVIYAWVGAAALLVVAVVGWVVSGRLLRPVRVLADTARRIGREDLAERIPVTGSDDLANMTSSVNEMLDRIEIAFDSQSRLVGDVSHELRTPLTIVRGHLELMDADDPADAREVRALVLDEVARMNRVVSDLSTLAAVERPDFVRRDELDLGTLTDDVFDKAVALGHREWELDERATGSADIDRERLTQAWLQLVANAVKFTQPGTRISLGSAISAGRARIWVTDAGPGVPEADHERIFERFERAGQNTVPGSGLGLTIVRAIAQAHGGDVAVSSTLGEGATFTVDFPAHLPPTHPVDQDHPQEAP